MTTTTDQVSELQVVHIHYRQRIELEDGPGSMQNVVSDASEPRTVYTERTTLADAQTLRGEDFEYCFWFEQDSLDGRDSHSYKLEWLDPDTGEWRLVKFL